MTPPESIRCPGCGSPSSIISHGKRYAVYPSGCLALIGPILAILHQASSPVDYECGTCGRKFSARSSVAKLCLGIIALVIFWTILGLLGALFMHR